MSPSQKSCDSAPNPVFPPSACSEKYTRKPFMYSCVTFYDRDVKATVFCYIAVSWPEGTLQLWLQVFHFPESTHQDKAAFTIQILSGVHIILQRAEAISCQRHVGLLEGNLKILFFHKWRTFEDFFSSINKLFKYNFSSSFTIHNFWCPRTEVHLAWLKHPAALSIFIHLIPPSKAHQQSARDILKSKKNSSLYTMHYRKVILLLCYALLLQLL